MESETIPSVIYRHENGYMIEELVKGKPEGKKAVRGARISVGYIGKLEKNGKVFVDLRETPYEFILGSEELLEYVEFAIGGPREGFRDAEPPIDAMRVGDKRRIRIPPIMGYRDRGDGNLVPPNAWLVYEVELVDIRDENSEISSRDDVNVKIRKMGLTIEVLVEGEPDGKIATVGKSICARYTGKLHKNGEIFCSELSQSPKEFYLVGDDLGTGFPFGVHGMRVGEKRKITVPPVYGFQQFGDFYTKKNITVPPHAWLVYEVELVDVLN